MLLFALLLVQTTAFSQAVIDITNPLSIAREKEIIEIPWKLVTDIYPVISSIDFQVVETGTKKQVPYQLAYQGTEKVQNLLVQVTVAAKGKLQLRIQKGKPAIFPSQTYCRYVPERKDDFAWENNKIAFRVYGSALEKFPKENAFGIDVWVKRTDSLVLNERYKSGDYHTDRGNGLDYYHVGYTLGAGGIVPYLKDSLCFPKNYAHWQVLDNGPLRSSFRLDYNAWDAGGERVSATKTISLDAGSQLSKTVVHYFFENRPILPVAVGIIKREQQGTACFDELNGVMGYWEPVHGKDGTTGVGCVFTKPVSRMLMNKEHLLSIASTKPNDPFIYYHGAAWDKAGEITDSKQWFNYLLHFQQKITQPMVVEIRRP